MANVVAPMACKVVGVKVKVGDIVAADQAMFTIEAMKMEMPIVASVAGKVVQVNVSVGQSVEADHVIAVLE